MLPKFNGSQEAAHMVQSARSRTMRYEQLGMMRFKQIERFKSPTDISKA